MGYIIMHIISEEEKLLIEKMTEIRPGFEPPKFRSDTLTTEILELLEERVRMMFLSI